MTFMLKIILQSLIFKILPPVAGHIISNSLTLTISEQPSITLILTGVSPSGLSSSFNASQNGTFYPAIAPSQSNHITAVPESNKRPENSQYDGLASCTLGSAACRSAGVDLSLYGKGMMEIPDECVLWDETCSGNRTLALDEFFTDTVLNITYDICFTQEEICKYHPPDQAEGFDKIRDFMRSPQCVSSANEWGSLFDIDQKSLTRSLLGATASEQSGSCCWQCSLSTYNVDIYYWPEPDVDTSCLSIVGDIVNPLGFGATTISDGPTYWGCTPKTPLTVYNAEAEVGGPDNGEIVQSIITTALLVNYGSIRYKEYVINPWHESRCDYEHSEF